MPTLIERLKSSERERERFKDQRLTDWCAEWHPKQDQLTGDHIGQIAAEVGKPPEHVISRMMRLDNRDAAAGEAVALPTLLAEQEADDAEQAERTAKYERETAEHEARSTKRKKQISRSSNRVEFMRDTAPFASWAYAEAMRLTNKAISSAEAELSRRVPVTGEESDLITWDHQRQDWRPMQFVDGEAASAALAAVRHRAAELEERKVALREQLATFEQVKVELLELALVPLPTAEQVKAIMGVDVTQEGGDDDGDDE